MNNIFRQMQPRPIFFCSDKTDFPAHLHSDIEIAFALNGSFTAFLDGRQYHVEKGEFFIAFPNQIHAYRDSDRNGQYAIMIFHPDILAQSGKEIRENLIPASPVVAMGKNAEKIVGMLKSFVRGFSRETPEVQSAYINLIFLLLERSLTFRQSDGKSDTAARIIAYCEAHFTEDIGIAQITRDLSLSHSYVSFLFGHRLQIPFRTYINSLRTEYAAGLLSDTPMKITEIAERSGFNNLRSFNRAFRLCRGVTPSAYRKRANP